MWIRTVPWWCKHDACMPPQNPLTCQKRTPAGLVMVPVVIFPNTKWQHVKKNQRSCWHARRRRLIPFHSTNCWADTSETGFRAELWVRTEFSDRTAEPHNKNKTQTSAVAHRYIDDGRSVRKEQSNRIHFEFVSAIFLTNFIENIYDIYRTRTEYRS